MTFLFCDAIFIYDEGQEMEPCAVRAQRARHIRDDCFFVFCVCVIHPRRFYVLCAQCSVWRQWDDYRGCSWTDILTVSLSTFVPDSHCTQSSSSGTCPLHLLIKTTVWLQLVVYSICLCDMSVNAFVCVSVWLWLPLCVFVCVQSCLS